MRELYIVVRKSTTVRLKTLAAAHHITWDDIVSEAGRKRAERGGFDHRIFSNTSNKPSNITFRIISSGRNLRRNHPERR